MSSIPYVVNPTHQSRFQSATERRKRTCPNMRTILSRTKCGCTVNAYSSNFITIMPVRNHSITSVSQIYLAMLVTNISLLTTLVSMVLISEPKEATTRSTFLGQTPKLKIKGIADTELNAKIAKWMVENGLTQVQGRNLIGGGKLPHKPIHTEPGRDARRVASLLPFCNLTGLTISVPTCFSTARRKESPSTQSSTMVLTCIFECNINRSHMLKRQAP